MCTVRSRIRSLGLLLVLLLAAACNTARSDTLISQNTKVMKGFTAAWNDLDPDNLLSFYAKDVKSLDATAYGMVFSYTMISDVLHSIASSHAFAVSLPYFFVSEDGRHAAAVGTFSELQLSGEYEPVPYVSLIEIDQGKIVWVFDYYGGVVSSLYPPQEIPASANLLASRESIKAARTALSGWESAYNDRDSKSFVSFYADGADGYQVIGPEWRQLSKSTFSQDLGVKFSSQDFTSKLADFFISADGNFAAVQGTYGDAEISERPMVVILELKGGKIIQEYDYMAFLGK